MGRHFDLSVIKEYTFIHDGYLWFGYIFFSLGRWIGFTFVLEIDLGYALPLYLGRFDVKFFLLFFKPVPLSVIIILAYLIIWFLDIRFTNFLRFFFFFFFFGRDTRSILPEPTYKLIYLSFGRTQLIVDRIDLYNLLLAADISFKLLVHFLDYSIGHIFIIKCMEK